MASKTADDRGALRPPAGDDITGRLRTQTGPRTTAPMWARPLLTDGEWAVFTAVWSFASWSGDNTFPSHQALADRAWVERGSAANAVRKFAALGLLIRARQTRADGSDTSNDYILVEVCPPALLDEIAKKMAERIAEQEAKRKARRKANRTNAAAVRARRAGTNGSAADDADEDLDDAAAEVDTDAAAQLASALAGEGALDDVPPGVHHTMHPGGTSPNGPGYIPQGTHDQSLDLSNDDQTIPRARDGSDESAAVAEPGKAATRGGNSLNEEIREKLNNTIDQVVAARSGVPGWTVGQVRRAAKACLDAGDAPADVIAALEYAATDKATRAPGRLPHIVAAIVETRTAVAPPQRAAAPPAGGLEGPFRYIDSDRPKCPKHPGHPGDNCGQCVTDARIAAVIEARAAAQKAAEDKKSDAPPTPKPGNGRAAARAAAAAAAAASPTKKATRKPAVPRPARPADPPPAPAADPAPELVSVAT